MLSALKEATNYTTTLNGAITHRNTLNGVLDLFALGGSYRGRTEQDCIALFSHAFAEDEELAMKCLFYLRDAREGQGERRFFRVIMRYLANNYTEIALHNLENIPVYGRWDDLYCLVDTPIEPQMFAFIEKQLAEDVRCETPSLLAKWLKSENASSSETRHLATRTRKALNLTSKEYRKLLSYLRNKIRIIERIMSDGRWDEIEFDKIPSRAGFKYRNAFARNDYTKERYKEFIESKKTKVNASVLYPYDIAKRCYTGSDWTSIDSTERKALQKYWENLPDYYNGRQENGIAVVDTSGSMYWGSNGLYPIHSALALGVYVAEKGKGPFANHFITFSSKPELQKIVGVDIHDKFVNMSKAEWGRDTNIEAVFDLLLETAISHNCTQEEMPNRIYIFSDMEFNQCTNIASTKTLMETMADRYKAHGYKLPNIIFWNLFANTNNIPAIGEGISYISGMSPVLIDTVLSGKTGWDLCLEKLTSERYQPIY